MCRWAGQIFSYRWNEWYQWSCTTPWHHLITVQNRIVRIAGGYLWANQAKSVQCPVREIFDSMGYVATPEMVYLYRFYA